MHEKIDQIMQNKSGFFFDEGESVLFILDSVEAIVKKMVICGGYKVNATRIHKITGEEDCVIISKPGKPFALDMDALMQFKPFGQSDNGLSLGKKLKQLFNQY